MNLTSKRMLHVFAGCAGAFALAATAETITYVADNFENLGAGYGPTTNGVANMPISVYKSQPWGEPPTNTNYLWYTESSDDLSKLVAEPQNYTGIRPMAGSETNLVLNLETNGKTLVRTNSAAVDFFTTPVYVDTLIKFTPSEENPSLDSMDDSVKAAVFVNVSSNLVIYHKDLYLAKTMTDTGHFIDPAQWYRLSILLSDIDSTPVFKVFLNGEAITSGAPVEGGWFISASGEMVFNAVAFQGTGMIDELVVTENEIFPPPSSTWLTMSFDPAQVDVLTNGIAIANYDSVKDGVSVSIIAKPWYQITSGGALLGSVTTNEFTAGVITGLVGTVTGSNGATNTIVSTNLSSTAGLPSGFGSASISSISTWASANGLSPAGVTEAMLDDYLLNVAPGTDAGLQITSITYGTGTVTVRIQATNPAVNFTTIYGTLNILTSDNLITDAFAPIARDTAFTFTSGTTYIDVSVVVGNGKFIKASINTTALEPL